LRTGRDAPLSSNRDVALREAAEHLIQTLPLEARTRANGPLLSNGNGAEFIKRCIWFQGPPKSAASSVKESALKIRGPRSIQPKLRLAIKDAVTVRKLVGRPRVLGRRSSVGAPRRPGCQLLAGDNAIVEEAMDGRRNDPEFRGHLLDVHKLARRHVLL
jgi:hypothetical protein